MEHLFQHFDPSRRRYHWIRQARRALAKSMMHTSCFVCLRAHQLFIHKRTKRKKKQQEKEKYRKGNTSVQSQHASRAPSRPGADLSCLRQLSALGLQKIDVCENLELCKGKAPSVKGFPSISLQVLCGSGCVKSQKFREKHRNCIFH